jgi:hypothetical protein
MKTYRSKPITETAEQAIQAKGQKGKIAKQIVLGIDAHLKLPGRISYGKATLITLTNSV